MRSRAVAALVAGAVLIGFVPLGVRMSELPPLATAFWRFALVAPLWMLLARRTAHVGSIRPGLLVAVGLAFSADIGCYFLSIHATTAANATLLSNAAPIVVLLGAFLFWREQPRGVAVLGTAIATVGAVLLVVEGAHVGGSRLTGDILGLISGFFYGIYQLLVGQLRRDHASVRIMAWVAVIGALVLGACALLAGETMLPMTGHGWAVLIGLAVVTQIGGQGLITWSLAHLPATFSSVVLLIQPLVAALIGVLIQHDPFTACVAAGGSLILVGIALASRARAPTPHGLQPDVG